MSPGAPSGGVRVLLLVAMLGCTASGCARRKRILQCNRFIDKVNLSLSQINKYTKTRADDPALESNMRKLSKLFEQLAKDIDAMGIDAPKLAPETRRYHDMCEHSAVAARHLADAVSKRDVGEAKSAEAEFRHAVREEAGLIHRINRICAR